MFLTRKEKNSNVKTYIEINDLRYQIGDALITRYLNRNLLPDLVFVEKS